jgi:hypothetical protein
MTRVSCTAGWSTPLPTTCCRALWRTAPPAHQTAFIRQHWPHTYHHGLINYKDTKTKCCHLKNCPVKGLCGRCWYFRPSFAPLTFSLVHTPPPCVFLLYLKYVTPGRWQCVAGTCVPAGCDHSLGSSTRLGKNFAQLFQTCSKQAFSKCRDVPPPPTSSPIHTHLDALCLSAGDKALFA